MAKKASFHLLKPLFPLLPQLPGSSVFKLALSYCICPLASETMIFLSFTVYSDVSHFDFSYLVPVLEVSFSFPGN